jgi:hypothetical protein
MDERNQSNPLSIINPDKLGHLGYPLSDLARSAGRN